jgi:hypothetical protein
LRRRANPSPKFSPIRQTALHHAKKHTALIWQQLRSEFSPAQVESQGTFLVGGACHHKRREAANDTEAGRFRVHFVSCQLDLRSSERLDTINLPGWPNPPQDHPP